jgi:hypothetical protein
MVMPVFLQARSDLRRGGRVWGSYDSYRPCTPTSKNWFSRLRRDGVFAGAIAGRFGVLWRSYMTVRRRSSDTAVQYKSSEEGESRRGCSSAVGTRMLVAKKGVLCVSSRCGKAPREVESCRASTSSLLLAVAVGTRVCTSEAHMHRRSDWSIESIESIGSWKTAGRVVGSLSSAPQQC